MEKFSLFVKINQLHGERTKDDPNAEYEIAE